MSRSQSSSQIKVLFLPLLSCKAELRLEVLVFGGGIITVFVKYVDVYHFLKLRGHSKKIEIHGNSLGLPMCSLSLLNTATFSECNVILGLRFFASSCVSKEINLMDI